MQGPWAETGGPWEPMKEAAGPPDALLPWKRGTCPATLQETEVLLPGKTGQSDLGPRDMGTAKKEGSLKLGMGPRSSRGLLLPVSLQSVTLPGGVCRSPL